MDRKLIVKNLSLSFVANIIVLICSILINLFLPKIFNVSAFGYWQLYILYCSYTALLHFGWNDGVYLRYGGYRYRDLNKTLFHSQFIMLIMFQIVVCTTLFFVILNINFENNNKKFILIMVLISSFIVIIRGFLLFILQATNKINEYAKVVILEKAILMFLLFLIYIYNVKDFKIIIYSDLFSKIVSLFYVYFICRDITSYRKGFKFTFIETKENMRSGIKISISFIASSLMIGIVRFGIEHTWSIVEFSQISLMLSLSNLFLTFINSFGIVFFPLLRNITEHKLRDFFIDIDLLISNLFLGLLPFYYLLSFIVKIWIPSYSSSLIYLLILFPILIFEGKMALLNNTIFKVIRAENKLMLINVNSLILSIILTYLSCFLFKNIILATVSILVILYIRYLMSNIYLSNLFEYKNFRYINEFVLVVLFIFSNYYFDIYGLFIYLIGYAFNLYLNKSELRIILEDRFNITI